MGCAYGGAVRGHVQRFITMERIGREKRWKCGEAAKYGSAPSSTETNVSVDDISRITTPNIEYLGSLISCWRGQ